MVVKVIAIEKDTREDYITHNWLVTLKKETGEQKTISVRAEGETVTTEDIRASILKSMDFLEINYPPFVDRDDEGIDEYKRKLRSWLPG